MYRQYQGTSNTAMRKRKSIPTKNFPLRKIAGQDKLPENSG